MSGLQILDIVLSSATIIGCALAVAFLVLGLRRYKVNKNRKLSGKRKVLATAWLFFTIIMLALCWTAPSFIGYDWETALVWQTYSVLTVPVSFTLLFASVTWFVYAGSKFRAHKITCELKAR